MPAPAISVRYISQVISGEDTVLFIPGNYRLGAGALPPLVWCHGAGQDDDAVFGTFKPVRLAEAGYCVIAGDFGGAQSWGNDVSTQRITASLNYARAEGWCSSDPAVFLSISMGGTVALNWIRQNMADTVGLIALESMFNMQSMYERNPIGGIKEGIDMAYGGTWDPVTYADTRDPAVYVNNGDLAGLKIITFYGNQDTVTPPADEADFAADHIANGGTITRNDVGPYTHVTLYDNVTPDDVVQAARSLTSELFSTFPFTFPAVLA